MESTRTIITADDDPQVRLALRTRLTAIGYNVVEACDGLGAIAKCRELNVFALILDHDMPLGQGRDIAANIRKYTKAPIIFHSGQDRESFRAVVLKTPNTYFLPKPLDSSRLVELLESLANQPVHAASH